MKRFRSIWLSTLRLTALLILLVLLNIFVMILSKKSLQKNVEFVSSYVNDVDYVLGTFDFMHELLNGRADIKSVFENERSVIQYWRCFIEFPEVIASKGWIKNDNYYLYSATFDRRPNSLYPSNYAIQVLLMSFRSIPEAHKIYCNIFDGNTRKYVVVEGTVREIWQRAWDPRDFFYIPNLISCPVPWSFQNHLNLSTSLTKTLCNSNPKALSVRSGGGTSANGQKSGIAVCVKGVNFNDDVSVRLIEWIEAQHLMGASTITMYVYHVHPGTQRVLDYYSTKGFMNVIPLDLPGNSPNQDNITRGNYIWRNRQQKRRHELIPYNDCLYRHIDTHEYILILDTDEVIVPIENDDWNSMLNDVIKTARIKDITSISVSNIFKFVTNMSNCSYPDYMFLLCNDERSEIVSKPGEYGKSFVSTKTVATVFNHFALHRLYKNVSKTIYVKEDCAIKLHYKKDCPIESRKECKKLKNVVVKDTALTRYAKRMVERVEDTLKVLGLFNILQKNEI